MGLKDVFKEIKKNVRSMDETMDHTDQEIDHFGKVLEGADESIAKFQNCISQADIAIRKIDQLTVNGEKLFAKLHSLVNIVENREMIIISFYGVIILTFLISILVVENLISCLILNSRSDQDRVISFFGSVFDFMLISCICFLLRILQLVMFIIVCYSCLQSVKKTILKQVDKAPDSSTSITSPQISSSYTWSTTVTETPSSGIPPTITVSQVSDSTPKAISEYSDTITESPISSTANNPPSSITTPTTNGDLVKNGSDRHSTDLSSENSSAATLSEALKSNLENALQIANSISQPNLEIDPNSNHAI